MFSLYLTGISLGVTCVYHHLASKMSLALFSLHHLIRYLKEAIRYLLCLACLGQNKPFSLSLYVMCSSSVDILVALVLDLLPYFSVFLARDKVFNLISLVRKRLMLCKGQLQRRVCQTHLCSSRQYNKGKQPLNTIWKAQVGHNFLFFFNHWKDSAVLEQVIQKGHGISHLEVFKTWLDKYTADLIYCWQQLHHFSGKQN